MFLFAATFRVVVGQAACTGAQIFAATACAGDVNSAEEKALFELVNSYRVARNMPALRLSPSLSMVANRRMLDLKQNLKTLTHELEALLIVCFNPEMPEFVRPN